MKFFKSTEKYFFIDYQKYKFIIFIQQKRKQVFMSGYNQMQNYLYWYSLFYANNAYGSFQNVQAELIKNDQVENQPVAENQYDERQHRIVEDLTNGECKKKKKIAKQSCSRKKDKNFSARLQDSSRNQFSNTLKYFFKFMQHSSQMDQKINKIIAYYNIMHYSAQQFLNKLQQYLGTKKHYIGPKLMIKLIESDQNFSKIFRILLRNYLKFEISPAILFQKKLSKKGKIKYLQNSKDLLKKLFKKKRQYSQDVGQEKKSLKNS